MIPPPPRSTLFPYTTLFRSSTTGSTSGSSTGGPPRGEPSVAGRPAAGGGRKDRKSTRLNSSHVRISYAVFCLKKKKKTSKQQADQHWRFGHADRRLLR